MKQSFLILLGTALLLSLRSPAASPSDAHRIFHLHFAGSDTIRKSGDGATAQALGKLPSSRELLGLALDHLSTLPGRLREADNAAAITESSALLRPLLDDLVQGESVLEWHHTPQGWAWLTAVQAKSDRAKAWNTALLDLCKKWGWGEGKPARTDLLEGWMIDGTGDGKPVQFWTGQGWVLVAAGPASQEVMADWIRRFKESQRPVPDLGKDWMDLRLRPGFLKALFPHLPTGSLSGVDLRWSAKEDQMFVTGHGDFAADLNLKLDAWQLPKSIIYEPLVSFTVARGVQPLLTSLGFTNILSKEPLPNQLCIWGQPNFYGQTLATLPMAKPTNAISELALTLPKTLSDAVDSLSGQIYWLSNKSEVVWRGLPLLSPFIKPTVVDKASYLITGLIPFLGTTNTLPPAELYQQFEKRENLVYYNWEITEQRLLHNRHYFQFAAIVSQRKTYRTNDVCFRWMTDIHKQLGNSVTEVTLANPRRLEFNRKSHLGLTGLELVLLSKWIEGEDFPLHLTWPKVSRSIPDHLRKSPPNAAPSAPPPPEAP